MPQGYVCAWNLKCVATIVWSAGNKMDTHTHTHTHTHRYQLVVPYTVFGLKRNNPKTHFLPQYPIFLYNPTPISEEANIITHQTCFC